MFAECVYVYTEFILGKVCPTTQTLRAYNVLTCTLLL